MVTLLIILGIAVLIFSQLGKERQESILDSTLRKLPKIIGAKSVLG